MQIFSSDLDFLMLNLIWYALLKCPALGDIDDKNISDVTSGQLEAKEETVIILYLLVNIMNYHLKETL